MYGADYAWILQEDLGSEWWLHENGDCTVKQLQAVVENMIIVSSHNSIVDGDSSFSGLVIIIPIVLSLCVCMYVWVRILSSCFFLQCDEIHVLF